MINVYCRRASDSARQLVAALKAQGAEARKTRRADNLDGLYVNWGERVVALHALGVWLNKDGPRFTKAEELADLEYAGVPTPEWRLDRPADMSGWLARRWRHHGANDLLAQLTYGNYYVRQVETDYEMRVHIIRGRSVRAGMKRPHGAGAHPVFRTRAAGWRLHHDADAQAYMSASIRAVAKQAVAALGYDFGAVDIGVTAGGEPIVWEVNSAPGLEPQTAAVYARFFKEVANALEHPTDMD